MFWDLQICFHSTVSGCRDKNGHKKEASWSDFEFENKVRSIIKTWKPNKDIANQFSIPGNTLATWKKNKEKVFEAFQISSLKQQRVKTGTYEKLNEAFLKWLTSLRGNNIFQSILLFFWRKLMNLLKPSITKILQHRTDDWGAGRKSKWYFPWVFICSSNQNNIRWITTFFIFSMNMARLPKRSLGSHKELLNRWLFLDGRQHFQQY